MQYSDCVHVQSTNTNGTITSIADTTDSNITCLFSVFASLGQRIQISCTNVNLINANSILIVSVLKLKFHHYRLAIFTHLYF